MYVFLFKGNHFLYIGFFFRPGTLPSKQSDGDMKSRSIEGDLTYHSGGVLKGRCSVNKIYVYMRRTRRNARERKKKEYIAEIFAGNLFLKKSAGGYRVPISENK